VGNLWALATFVGPILLAAAIIWAIARNRRQRPGEIARSERATHDLYEREDRDRRAHDQQR
jgi:hypothetical protein